MFELYDHQRQAIDDLAVGFDAGHRRQILTPPTGAGKTVVAGELATRALARAKRVLSIVHTLFDEAGEKAAAVDIVTSLRAIEDGFAEAYRPDDTNVAPRSREGFQQGSTASYARASFDRLPLLSLPALFQSSMADVLIAPALTEPMIITRASGVDPPAPQHRRAARQNRWERLCERNAEAPDQRDRAGLGRPM